MDTSYRKTEEFKNLVDSYEQAAQQFALAETALDDFLYASLEANGIVPEAYLTMIHNGERVYLQVARIYCPDHGDRDNYHIKMICYKITGREQHGGWDYGPTFYIDDRWDFEIVKLEDLPF